MPYIVMELLEGQNLRDRIDGRPMGARKTLEIAAQVARGLAVAHEKNLIHRDLKPENIFVEPNGQVKILDFGLAKLMTPPTAGADQTRQQRLSQGLTQPGTLVGTAGYMSPEQVNGGQVDHRSDLFSFGIILFEMLSGSAPFRRPSMVETMHAILKDDPPELGPELRLTPVLERTILRCLEKDPRQRFQTASDLLFNLEGSTLVHTSTMTRHHLALPKRGLPAWALKASLAAGALALAGAAFVAGRGLREPEQLVYRRLTYRRGVVQDARFSPDGQTYVFGLAGDGKPAQILVGRTEGVGARPLDLPPGTRILSISSTGEMALLFRKPGETEGTLALAPLSGGAPREVLEHVFSADWGPGGQDLAVLRSGENSHYILEYPIGHKLYDGPPITPALMDFPRVSPKGDRVAFLEHLGIGKETLSVVDLKGRRTDLVHGGCDSLQWSPDGTQIFYTFHYADDRKELRSVSLSGRQRVLDTQMGRNRVLDISRTGRLLVGQSIERNSLLFTGPTETTERDLSWLTTSGLADLSANGERILLGETLEGSGPGGAYLRRTDGSDALRLGDGDPLALSPDGKWALVLSTDAHKSLSIFPTGPGSPRLLCKEVRADWALFVEGGRQVLLAGVGADGQFRAYLQDVAGGPPRPWPGKATPEAYCVVSPDGAKVALGPMNGHIALFTAAGRSLGEVGGLQDGDYPIQFHSSGNSVFLANLSGLPAQVLLLDLATGKRQPWKKVGPLDPSGVEQIKNVSITPDGKSLAYSFVRVLTSDLYLTDPIR
jgi:hypothetical protein